MSMLDLAKVGLARLRFWERPDNRDDAEDRARAMLNGQIVPLPTVQTRWHQGDLEQAIIESGQGDMSRAAHLCNAMRRDGVLSGVLSTRTGGMVRLPRTLKGRDDVVAMLQGEENQSGLFEMVFPAAELALIAADGILLGVAVAELLPVQGAPFKVLRRLNPEWLQYRWYEDRWYYNSIAGPLPITPGDGRWVLHTPGGQSAPWTNGLWAACGRSWIAKEHAFNYRENFSGKLAHPARYARAPLGATPLQRRGMLRNLISWGINTVFELPVGWEVGLLESNGEGYEVFNQTVATCDNELIVAIAGQTVTTDGGKGFVNGDMFKSIRADLIEDTARSVEHTLNTQGIPIFINDMFGADALNENCTVHYDTTPPKDKKVEADAQRTAADAAKSWDEIARTRGKAIDLVMYAAAHGVPLRDATPAEGASPTTGQLPEVA